MLPEKLKMPFAILSSGLFILLLIASLFMLYNAPVLGIEKAWDSKDHQWTVVSAIPGSPLKQGDRLIMINGLTLGFHHLLTDNIYIESREDLFDWFHAKWEIYDRLNRHEAEVVFLRNGQMMNTVILVQRESFSFLYRIEALHLLVGFAFFLIGLIVFWKKGFAELSLVFFLMCMAMMFIFITNAASMMSEIVYKPLYFSLMNILNVMSTLAGTALIFHFSLLMPGKRRFLARFPWLIVLYYLFCTALAVTLSVQTINLIFPFFLIGTLIALGQGFISYKDPIQKQQTKWVIAGFGLSLLPFVLLNGIPMVITGQRLVNDTIPGIFFLLIPLFMAFAIQKYHLMDIDSLFDNTLIYTATFGALTIMDLGVLSLFSKINPDAYQAYGSLATVLSIWLAIVLYVPVRSKFREWIKRLLKRELYDLNEISLRLSGRLISVADIPSVFEKTLGVIDETLHPLGGCPYLFTGERSVYVTSLASGDLPRGWVDEARKLASSTHLYQVFKPEDIPAEYAAGVLVPMSGPAGISGCMALKNKHSGRMYDRDDLNLLDMVARQASLAIESIISREVMHRKEKETQEIREHISREMHDGIGSSFSNAIMMLDLLSKEVSHVAGSDKRIMGLKDLLNDGLSDIRNLIRTMEEEGSTLEDLAVLLKDKTDRLLADKGIKYGVLRDIGKHGLPLSPLVIHHFLRIVQEGITNVLKHSGATEIQIRLREKDGLLSVSITDNGKGFDIALLDAGGYGLRNMKRRCDAMGADLRFSSSPGKGANITVILPLPLSAVSPAIKKNSFPE